MKVQHLKKKNQKFQKIIKISFFFQIQNFIKFSKSLKNFSFHKISKLE